MLIRILKYFLLSSGCLFLLLIILCFTPIPFRAWYDLSLKKAGIHRAPEWIIVLGGGGMPSETGLMRTWYASKLATQHPGSNIIIALPGNVKDSLSSVNLMRNEMIHRGISPERIILEDSGTNTRAQSLHVFKKITEIFRQKPLHPDLSPGTREINTKAQKPDFTHLVVVTSPEHLYRAVLTFRKAGFLMVDGLPAFDRTIESDITFTDNRLGGRKWIPELGKNLTVRYRFWSQMRYMELTGREYCAIFYYWLKGWI